MSPVIIFFASSVSFFKGFVMFLAKKNVMAVVNAKRSKMINAHRRMSLFLCELISDKGTIPTSVMPFNSFEENLICSGVVLNERPMGNVGW